MRAIQMALMPGLARTPSELVAANVASSTGEGLGTFLGPLLAGLLVGVTGSMTSSILVAAAFASAAAAATGVASSTTPTPERVSIRRAAAAEALVSARLQRLREPELV